IYIITSLRTLIVDEVWSCLSEHLEELLVLLDDLTAVEHRVQRGNKILIKLSPCLTYLTEKILLEAPIVELISKRAAYRGNDGFCRMAKFFATMSDKCSGGQPEHFSA